MARAWIPLTGLWGPDQQTLGAWERWNTEHNAGYTFARSITIGTGDARLMITASGPDRRRRRGGQDDRSTPADLPAPHPLHTDESARPATSPA